TSAPEGGSASRNATTAASSCSRPTSSRLRSSTAPPLSLRPRSLDNTDPRPGQRPGGDDGRVSLLERDDSVLVVVDAQPGFLARAWFPAEDAAASRWALDRMAGLVAVAARLAVPIVATEEEPDRNGATDARLGERFPAATPVLTKPTFGLTRT